VGDAVGSGPDERPLAIVHARTADAAEAAAADLRAAYRVSRSAPPRPAVAARPRFSQTGRVVAERITA
jgi:hypothetical protein